MKLALTADRDLINGWLLIGAVAALGLAAGMLQPRDHATVTADALAGLHAQAGPASPRGCPLSSLAAVLHPLKMDR